MRICIVNQSRLSDVEVQKGMRAVNAQLFADFIPHWSVAAQTRLEGTRGKTMSMKELRGDAILYIGNEPEEGALGWHDADKYGVPYGIVYTDFFDEPWTVTLSHEVLEIALDPHVNVLCAGPHPTEKRTVFHWREASDAVQADSYKIGGIPVSDFVLPAYFTPAEELGMRRSFMGANIKSFGVAPGGYIGFFDPELGGDDTYAMDDVGRAACAKKRPYGRSKRYANIGAKS